MLRLAAVRSLLLHDVAGLPRDDDGDADLALDRLAAATRRAGAVAALDLAAIAALLAAQQRGVPFLALGDDLGRAVFTVGVLVVAFHAGLRLGQRLLYRAVARAVAGLPKES